MKTVFKKLSVSITAAFAASTAYAVEPNSESTTNPSTIKSIFDKISPTQLIDSETDQYFLGHSSHYSHSSHKSHYSHRSSYNQAPPMGSGEDMDGGRGPISSDPLGQDAKPTLTYAPDGPTKTDREDLVRRVQLQLKLLGNYEGPIDGVLADSTRAAIDQLKTSKNLNTGRYLDAETLNLLGVPAS